MLLLDEFCFFSQAVVLVLDVIIAVHIVLAKDAYDWLVRQWAGSGAPAAWRKRRTLRAAPRQPPTGKRRRPASSWARRGGPNASGTAGLQSTTKEGLHSFWDEQLDPKEYADRMVVCQRDLFYRTSESIVAVPAPKNNIEKYVDRITDRQHNLLGTGESIVAVPINPIQIPCARRTWRSTWLV